MPDLLDQHAAALRAEVSAWLDATWSLDLPATRWRQIAVDSGWAFPSWPRETYGRGIDAELAYVVEEEFRRRGAPSPAFGPGLDPNAYCLGSAMQAHGSEAMKRDLLGPVIRGELGQGCYLYSEPSAGSDLAALRTRAERDGDGYRINGQKIWSGAAATADYGLLVARTNWDVPKHAGISYFLFPFKIDGQPQPGVDIRPIRQMTGESEFNEVFFNDAWVPAEYLVGQENDGWRVLQTALAAERIFMTKIFRESEPADADSVLHAADDLLRAARSASRINDPVIRQLIAQLHTWRLAQAWTSQRASEELRSAGSSSLASLGKLANSRILHTTARLLRHLQGPEALLYDYDDIDMKSANLMVMRAFTNSIGGGSDQIQRNIIGERILGLPRPEQPDRGKPFRATQQIKASADPARERR